MNYCFLVSLGVYYDSPHERGAELQSKAEVKRLPYLDFLVAISFSGFRVGLAVCPFVSNDTKASKKRELVRF
jgi:hypothetical protein